MRPILIFSALTFVAVLLIYGLSLTVPYYLEVDVGIQFKAIEQYLAGVVHYPNQVALTNLDDISKLDPADLVWSAPALAYIYCPLFKLGWTPALAAKTTSLILFLVAIWGFFQLASSMRFSRIVWILLAVDLPCWYILVGGPFIFWADVIPFAAFPWLCLYFLHFLRKHQLDPQSPGEYPTAPTGRIFIVGLLIGLTYFLKYSLFFGSAGLAFFLGLILIFNPGLSVPAKIKSFTALSLGVVLPVILLQSIQAIFCGGTSVQYANYGYEGHEWVISDYKNLLWVLGSLGVSIFHLTGSVQHLAFYTPFFTDHPGYDINKDYIYSLLLTPISIGGVWALYSACRTPNTRTSGLLMTCVVLVDFLLLGYASYKYSMDIILYSARYTSCFAPLLHMIIFEVIYLHLWQSTQPARRALALALLGLFLFGWVTTNYIGLHSGYVEARRAKTVADQKGLYLTYLTTHDLGDFVRRVEATRLGLKDPIGVIVPIPQTPQYGSWMAFRDPILPLTSSVNSTTRHYGLKSLTQNPEPILTSQPLRVILVVTKDFLSSELSLQKLQARFTQAGPWQQVPPRYPDEAEIWYADLKTSP